MDLNSAKDIGQALFIMAPLFGVGFFAGMVGQGLYFGEKNKCELREKPTFIKIFRGAMGGGFLACCAFFIIESLNLMPPRAALAISVLIALFGEERSIEKFRQIRDLIRGKNESNS